MSWFTELNDHYASAVQAITPWILAGVSGVYATYLHFKGKEGDAAAVVSPRFFCPRGKFSIQAVHKMVPSDAISGYTGVGQNSRRDQWDKLIEVRKLRFGLWREIVPIDSADILTVIISRNGKEKWKSIEFNK